MSELSTDVIPYREYRAINQLRDSHGAEHEGKLRGLVAFGDWIGAPNTDNVNLLEIVEDWHGLRHVEFEASAQLRFSGRLSVYFLKPEEFENPTEEMLAGEQFSSYRLLEKVRKAYVIIREQPDNYVRGVLNPDGLMAEDARGTWCDTPEAFFAQQYADPSRAER